MGQVGRGVARRQHLPLLRDAEAPAHRSGRLGADGAAGRPAAAGHAAAAPVEERQADAVVPADAGDSLLRPVERPVGREVSAVLVAVGVPDHDRLLAAAGRQVGAVGLQREELGQHGRRLVEIVERLEERRHREPGGPAGPAGEDEDGQHVGGRRAPSRSRTGPKSSGPYTPRARARSRNSAHVSRAASSSPSGLGGRGRAAGRRRGEPRVRGPARRPAASRPPALHAPGVAELVERPGEAPGILPEIEAGRMEAEQVDLRPNGPEPVLGEGRGHARRRADRAGRPARRHGRAPDAAGSRGAAPSCPRRRRLRGPRRGGPARCGRARRRSGAPGTPRAREGAAGRRAMPTSAGGERQPPVAHAEPPREILKRATVLRDGEAPVQPQRLRGDGRGDVRVPVPVAADPRAQPEPPAGDGQTRVVLGHRAASSAWTRGRTSQNVCSTK